jgi:hypothetical protein
MVLVRMRGLLRAFRSNLHCSLRRKAAVTWLDFRATKNRGGHANGVESNAASGILEPVFANPDRDAIARGAEQQQQVGLAWLLKLRWGALDSQLAIFLVDPSSFAYVWRRMGCGQGNRQPRVAFQPWPTS